jgi:serine/threonine-protein kinase
MAEDELAPQSATAQPDPYVGRVLAERYRILALLGDGGMSRVYVGQHLVIERRVAVKILLPALATDQMFVRRFLDEGRAAGTIGHPNIAASLDMGYAPDGVPFLVFELLDGINLSHEIARLGGLDVGRAAYVGVQIAAALNAAHAREIIHRDLKPENVFLIREGTRPDHVKVVDFGISKFTRRDHVDRQTQAGVILGTPDYMAPEQVLDVANVDARTDIYALGTILYTAVAGRPPFDGQPFPHILHVIVADPPPALGTLRPEVPAEFVAVIAQAMAKDREHRYATMSELAAALEPFVVEPPAARERVPSLQHFGRDASRRSGISARPELTAAAGPVASTGASTAITTNPAIAASKEPALRPSQRTTLAPARRIGPWLLPVLFAAGAAAWLLVHRFASQHAAIHGTVANSAPAGPLATALPGALATLAPPVATVNLEITCDATAARATLRSKSFDLPYHGSLSSSPNPEAIEVTAPGFQGRRFWVSLVSSRQLTAHLKRGSGLLEATASETALALDESRAPTAAAWAHPSLPAARPSSQKGLAGPAPRSPDRAESEPTSLPPTPVATPRPPQSPASSPAVEGVAPISPARAAPEPPSVAPGTVDRKAANAVIRAHTGEIQSCLVRARMDNPDAGGRIALQASVAPDGRVTGVSITSSNANSARLEQCVLGAFRSWTLPAPSGGIPGSLTYAFNLQ